MYIHGHSILKISRPLILMNPPSNSSSRAFFQRIALRTRIITLHTIDYLEENIYILHVNIYIHMHIYKHKVN